MPLLQEAAESLCSLPALEVLKFDLYYSFRSDFPPMHSSDVQAIRDIDGETVVDFSVNLR